jgi:Transposase DDE domain group 1
MLDFDATPITAHSDNERAARHYKGGLGFNPLLVSCAREVLAAILRRGNAGADNAVDDLDLFELALEQLPREALDERVREAILALPEAAWRPAIDGDNQPRDGAWVAELTDHLALAAWPEGSRLIVRRERPHPGAQPPARDDARQRK